MRSSRREQWRVARLFRAEQELTGPQGRPGSESVCPQRALTTRAPHACYSKAGATRGTSQGYTSQMQELNSPCKTADGRGGWKGTSPQL